MTLIHTAICQMDKRLGEYRYANVKTKNGGKAQLCDWRIHTEQTMHMDTNTSQEHPIKTVFSVGT